MLPVHGFSAFPRVSFNSIAFERSIVDIISGGAGERQKAATPENKQSEINGGSGGGGGGGGGGGDPSDKGDCTECRVTGTVTCYFAAAYIAAQRSAAKPPSDRRFLACFSAFWFVLGTARALL
jgi:hypothetical protein